MSCKRLKQETVQTVEVSKIFVHAYSKNIYKEFRVHADILICPKCELIKWPPGEIDRYVTKIKQINQNYKP